MTHRITELAALVLLWTIPSGPSAAETKLQSRAADRPLIVDGSWADWDGLPIASLATSLRNVSFSHDEDNVFVMFRFGDERLARLLLHRGVILWFNGDGRTNLKDETFGVRYAGSKSLADSLGGVPTDPADEEVARSGRGSGVLTGRPRPGELTVIRFGVKEIVSEGHPAGPEAASAFHDGVYCYELRIPLLQIGGKAASTRPTKTRRIAVGIQIGGTTKAERESIESGLQDSLGRGGGPISTGRGDGGPGGGTGGGGLGGIGGPGGGGGRPEMGTDPSSKTDPFNPMIEWLKIELTPAAP